MEPTEELDCQPSYNLLNPKLNLCPPQIGTTLAWEFFVSDPRMVFLFFSSAEEISSIWR